LAVVRTGNVERALDALNFFLADVRDGLGPYLAIYLLTEQKWDEASIGIVMSVAAIAGIIAQTPAGALIDRSTAKRALMVTAAILVTLSCIALPLIHRFELVAATQAIAAAAGAIFAPAVAAVTLGIVGPRAFARRTGRNEAFNHAGNAVAAAIAGATAYSFGPIVVFWLLAAMAVASIFATLAIPGGAIDHHAARGLDDTAEPDGPHRDKPSGFQVLLTCRPLLIFAVATVAFHFSNAAMLPLVGQKLALEDKNLGTSLMSACIVAAQIVMVPMAMLVGARADAWGHKRFFLMALVILPIRAALYTLSDNQAWLVGVQLLDGIGAGIFGAIFPVIVADLMRNTGRFNVAQGAVITAQSIGAALSTTLAGLVVVKAGYSAAFLTLGGVAALGVAVCWFTLHETGERSASSAARLKQTAPPASGIAAE